MINAVVTKHNNDETITQFPVLLCLRDDNGNDNDNTIVFVRNKNEFNANIAFSIINNDLPVGRKLSHDLSYYYKFRGTIEFCNK